MQVEVPAMLDKKDRNCYSLASRDKLTEKTVILLFDQKLLIIDKNMPALERLKNKDKIYKFMPLVQ